MSNQPILSVTYKRGEQNFSVLSVWPGKFPGTYSVSLDKGTDKYPAIGFLDVLKAFAARDGFVNIRVDSESEPRQQRSNGGGSYDRAAGNSSSGFSGDSDVDFDDGSIPF